jgi:hypothetical protein
MQKRNKREPKSDGPDGNEDEAEAETVRKNTQGWIRDDET